MDNLDKQLIPKLVDIITTFHNRGWSYGTSTNYSLRFNQESFLISKSGIDKKFFHHQDFLHVDFKGSILDGQVGRPSAETLLHAVLYEKFPAVKCVLHSHSVASTILSKKYLFQEYIEFYDYEMIKGIGEIKDHLISHKLPILPNSQDMNYLSKRSLDLFNMYKDIQGYLIAGHGLYAFGNSIEEAKRHMEIYEFLLECNLRSQQWQ